MKMLNEQIEQLEYNDKQNKDISKRLKGIEKIINEEEQPMEIFDDVKFENLVEKIIIGEKDIDGNSNHNTIRFVLKIGTEYKFKDLYQTRKQEITEQEYDSLSDDEKRFYQRKLTRQGNLYVAKSRVFCWC